MINICPFYRENVTFIFNVATWCYMSIITSYFLKKLAIKIFKKKKKKTLVLPCSMAPYCFFLFQTFPPKQSVFTRNTIGARMRIPETLFYSNQGWSKQDLIQNSAWKNQLPDLHNWMSTSLIYHQTLGDQVQRAYLDFYYNRT